MDGHLSQHLHGKALSVGIGSVGMLLSPRAQKSLKNIEKIQLRMMVATFNGTPAE